MRIVEGRGKYRRVTEIPDSRLLKQDDKALETLVINMQEKICGASFALRRKGWNLYH